MPSRECLGTRPTNFINMSSTSDLPITSYEWFFDDSDQPLGGRDSTRNTSYAYPDSGSYQVMLVLGDDLGCTDTVIKPVIVDFPFEVDAFTDTSICLGFSAQLEAFGGDSIIWEPASSLDSALSTTPVATPAFSTVYVATIKNGVCPADTAQVNVLVKEQPQAETIEDVTIVKGSSIDLNTVLGDYEQLYWSTDDTSLVYCDTCPEPTVTLLETTTFVLTVIDTLGCIGTDTVTININERCDEDQIFVGNGFTPNNDGRNDIAFARLLGLKQMNYYRIFDRWGNLVFETTDPDQGWDGKSSSGKQLNSGVYVYVVEAECFSGQKLTRTGNVTLIK